MRRMLRLGLLPLFLCAVFLTACGKTVTGQPSTSGLVTEVHTGADGSLRSFVFQTGDGRQLGVLLTDKTRLSPPESGVWTSAELQAYFQEALQPDVKVSVTFASDKQSLTTEGGAQIDAYEADYADITGKLNRGAVRLRDGTSIDMLEDSWSVSERIYYLSDGTELLWVRGSRGPANVYVGSLESFDDLSEAAKEKVTAWYEERGLLYDEEKELEEAYAAWKEQGEDFRSRMVDQDVSPSASSDRVMYFGTYATLPLDHGDGCTSYTLSLGDAFDRETGEHLSLWDLFRCSEEEARRAILDAALDWPGSEGVRAEVEAAFSPERVVVRSDSLSMDYEPGSMPSQEHGYSFSVKLGQIKDLMYDWAVPKNPQ